MYHHDCFIPNYNAQKADDLQHPRWHVSQAYLLLWHAIVLHHQASTIVTVISGIAVGQKIFYNLELNVAFSNTGSSVPFVV